MNQLIEYEASNIFLKTKNVLFGPRAPGCTPCFTQFFDPWKGKNLVKTSVLLKRAILQDE